jgi:hypothetical protein
MVLYLVTSASAAKAKARAVRERMRKEERMMRVESGLALVGMGRVIRLWYGMRAR